MSAFAPRRTFATPLVITLAALPTLSGCGADSSAPPPVAPVERGHGPILNPPPPGHHPAPQSQAQRWSLSRVGDACTSFLRSSGCPAFVPGQPGPSCNPPPPQKYDCPPGLVAGADWIIVQSAPGQPCEVERAMPPCPSGANCNPPPPQQVKCPQ